MQRDKEKMMRRVGFGLVSLILFVGACTPTTVPTQTPRAIAANTGTPPVQATEVALTPGSVEVSSPPEIAGTTVPSSATSVAAGTPFPIPNPATVSNGGAAGAVEFETLPIRERVDMAVSVQEMTTYDAKRWSGGKQFLASARNGALLRFIVIVDKAGTYAFNMYATRAPDFGQVQVRLDGKVLGDPLDLYAPTVLPSGAINLGNVELTPGAHDLAFTVVGKNSASRDYKFGLDSYSLMLPGATPVASPASSGSTPTVSTLPSNPTVASTSNIPGAYEFETLPMKDKTDMDCEVLNGTTGIQWSSGKRISCTGKQIGARVRFTVPLERTGRYMLNLYAGKSPNGAMVQITWDGQPWEAPVDLYAAALTPTGRLAVGVVDLGAGPHDLGFRVVGKNGSSTGFGLTLDAMTLITAP